MGRNVSSVNPTSASCGIASSNMTITDLHRHMSLKGSLPHLVPKADANERQKTSSPDQCSNNRFAIENMSMGEKVEMDFTHWLIFGNASSTSYISMAERLLCCACHEKECVKRSASRLGARLLLPANRSGSTWSMAKRLQDGQAQVHMAELVASREILFEYLTLGCIRTWRSTSYRFVWYITVYTSNSPEHWILDQTACGQQGTAANGTLPSNEVQSRYHCGSTTSAAHSSEEVKWPLTDWHQPVPPCTDTFCA